MSADRQLDRDVKHLVSSYARLRWASVIALVSVVIIAFLGLAVVAFGQQQQIHSLKRIVETQGVQDDAACRFWTDLIKLPTQQVPPPTKHPSAVGITLVIDAHDAALGLHCPAVPPLDSQTLYWAGVYHIHVTP